MDGTERGAGSRSATVRKAVQAGLGDFLAIGSLAVRPESDAFAGYRDPMASLRAVYRIEPLIAALAGIVLAPVAALIAVIIAVLSHQSPLVRHRRVGWRGKELRVVKFRTMWGCEPRSRSVFSIEDLPEVPAVIKTEQEERITSRFAAWCRRYSLDEIPQLAHIVLGEMSFVGPRPITRLELDEHYGVCSSEVLLLRPGLTGLWQVMGRNRLSYAQRRRLDLLLVRHASPKFFLRILIRTIPRVVGGDGAC